MKAAVYHRYGGPLEIREVPKPSPKDGEVLIRVHAAALNSWDWDLFAGTPQGRLGQPSKPRYAILGADVAGIVEAVGPGNARLKPGDAVFGDISSSGWGALAEFVAAQEKYLALKPAEMTFEQAAATPQAGMLALQGMRKCRLRPGDKVLINGAGGGVGTFALQMARSAGAEVTGVDHATKFDTMREAGADHVIDYTVEDFAKAGRRYDFILDVTASRSMLAYARALNPGGVLAVIGGRTGALLSLVTLGSLISVLGSRKLRIVIFQPSIVDLEEMKRLFTSGAVRPVIDRVFPLEQAAEAFRCLGEARAKGKVVISIGQPA